MDHVDIMLDGDLDDLVSGQIGTDRSILTALADDIGLIRLLPMHTEAVLIAENCHGMQREFVGGTEDTDWDFASIGNCGGSVNDVN
jgi:hypothetical protein